MLIAEACTHHRQSDDIASVKIPRWLRELTGRQLQIEHAAGSDFPAGLGGYSLIIHCGACMLNRRAMLGRLEEAEHAGVPIVNYGVFIAYVQGVFPRAIEMFPSAMLAWEEGHITINAYIKAGCSKSHLNGCWNIPFVTAYIGCGLKP